MKRSKATDLAKAAVVAGFALLATAPGAGAQTPQVCQDARLPVYFERRSAEVDQTSSAALASALETRAGCRILGATLVGRGDASGPGRGDQGLARRRAEAVAARLRDAGVPGASIAIITRPGQATARSILERRVTVHLSKTSR